MTARTADPGGHRLLIRSDGRRLKVTCTCLLVRVRGPEVQARNKAGVIIGSWRPSYFRREFIESRTRFPAAEAATVWRAWHERGGILL
jgi:hypothetical protein